MPYLSSFFFFDMHAVPVDIVIGGGSRYMDGLHTGHDGLQ